MNTTYLHIIKTIAIYFRSQIAIPTIFQKKISSIYSLYEVCYRMGA